MDEGSEMYQVHQTRLYQHLPTIVIKTAIVVTKRIISTNLGAAITYMQKFLVLNYCHAYCCS